MIIHVTSILHTYLHFAASDVTYLSEMFEIVNNKTLRLDCNFFFMCIYIVNLSRMLCVCLSEEVGRLHHMVA